MGYGYPFVIFPQFFLLWLLKPYDKIIYIVDEIQTQTADKSKS